MAVTVVADNTTGLDQRNLSMSLGSALVGDVVIVQLVSEDTTAAVAAPTNSGTAAITFTQRQKTTTASKSWCATYSGTVTGAGTVTVAAVASTSRNHNHGGCSYLFPAADGYSLAGSPVSYEVISTGAPSTNTQAYTSTGNVVCLVNGDFNAITGARTYRTGLGTPTEDSVAQGGNNGQYFFHYPSITGTSGIMGLTAPTGQAFTIQGIEVLFGAGGGAVPPPQQPAQPGLTWRRHFLRAQQNTPPIYSGAPQPTLVTLTDTGVGADAITETATVPLADTGTATDTLVVAVVVPLADVGTGTDSLLVSATLPLADVGSGADVISATATVTLTDTGSGADSVGETATVPLTDVGSGVDAINVVTGSNPSLPDTGTGTDALTVAATLPLADTGSGADALAASAAVPLADTGHGADALTVTVVLTLADTGTGTDTVTVTATVPLSDVGSGVDAISVNTGGNPSLPDTGHGTDGITVTATLALGDTATALDGISVSVLTATEAVYLYRPPSRRERIPMGGRLIPSIVTSTCVYRIAGVWYNIQDDAVVDHVVAQCDIDTSGLRLFFNKPMVIPGHLHDELAAITPAKDFWTPGTLTLL